MAVAGKLRHASHMRIFDYLSAALPGKCKAIVHIKEKNVIWLSKERKKVVVLLIYGFLD